LAASWLAAAAMVEAVEVFVTKEFAQTANVSPGHMSQTQEPLNFVHEQSQISMVSAGYHQLARHIAVKFLLCHQILSHFLTHSQ